MTLSPAFFLAAGTAGGSALVSATTYFDSTRRLGTVVTNSLIGGFNNRPASDASVRAAVDLVRSLQDHLQRRGKTAYATELLGLIDRLSEKIDPDTEGSVGRAAAPEANGEVMSLQNFLRGLPDCLINGWEVSMEGIRMLVGAKDHVIWRAWGTVGSIGTPGLLTVPDPLASLPPIPTPPFPDLGQIVGDDPWLAREIARRREHEPTPWEQIVIAGMIPRLLELDDGEDSVARGIPLVARLKEWAGGLSFRERERIAAEAMEAMKEVIAPFLIPSEEIGSDPARLEDAVHRLLRSRDDLQGVVDLLEIGGPLQEGQLLYLRRFLDNLLDSQVRDLVTSRMPNPGFLRGEEWLRRASTVSPDGWWTAPVEW